jgi:DNA-binding XRE family transcriptional regulator/desulfoferrodoxin (superoxide reductase-like protein)
VFRIAGNKIYKIAHRIYETQVANSAVSWYAFCGKGVAFMDTYVAGLTIKQLREKRNMTQAELADQIGVSSKTISKWETAKGLPDISLLQPLAQALGISVIELMNGQQILNKNISANMLRSRFYVCPICGNAIHALGNSVVSCCGITLHALEAEEADETHAVTIEEVEDEHFITIHHPMTKQHYVSFVAFVTSDRIQMVKLYPEGNAQTRLQLRGMDYLYYYCNQHGLFRKKK